MTWSITKTVYKNKKSAIENITDNISITNTVKNLILETLHNFPEDEGIILDYAESHQPLLHNDYPILQLTCLKLN